MINFTDPIYAFKAILYTVKDLKWVIYNNRIRTFLYNKEVCPLAAICTRKLDNFICNNNNYYTFQELTQLPSKFIQNIILAADYTWHENEELENLRNIMIKELNITQEYKFQTE